MTVHGAFSRGISARVPDAIPFDERAEQRTPTRDGPVVFDADIGVADALGDGAVLTERDALPCRGTGCCGEQ